MSGSLSVPPQSAGAAALSSLAARAIRWQTVHGRNNLPWQNTRDPYRVWLSEVMLQQTQVATVVSYFSRFVQRLPDVAALAAADADEVLALWSGLGYYSRARNLHRCAVEVVTTWGGEFPRSAEALATLPGIGRSTAAAIAALCFGERVAILDANVRRVLSRVLAFDADLATQAGQRALWAAATELLPQRDLKRAMPRYTQAMMDIGATVCAVRQPACGACPLAELCRARQSGSAESFPRITRKNKRSAQSVWLLWAHTRDAAVWLDRRPPVGVWGGLYCLPWFHSRDDLIAALPKRHHSALHDLVAFRHVLTHKDLHLHPVRLLLGGDALASISGRWFGAGQWPGLGLPAPVRVLLQG